MVHHRSNKMDDEIRDEVLTADDETEDDGKKEDETIEMLERLAKDYSAYLEVDASKEKAKFGDTIEDMLTKLDEFGSLVDMIRSDSTLCLTSTLPKIQQKQAEIRAVFDKVDRLQAFVSMVRDNTAVMEECVNRAEEEMGSFSGLKKMLSSFVSPKRSPTKDNKTSSYSAPKIFNTEDYFPKPPRAEEIPASGTIRSDSPKSYGDVQNLEAPPSS